MTLKGLKQSPFEMCSGDNKGIHMVVSSGVQDVADRRILVLALGCSKVVEVLSRPLLASCCYGH